MTNSILIGITIYEKLSESTKLKEYIDNRIYPLIANNDVFPFIIFYRDAIKSISNKDGYNEDEVNFTIVVASNKYLESLEIANEVRTILEKRKLIGNNIIITDTHIEGVDEVYEENNYYQKLYFSCKIN